MVAAQVKVLPNGVIEVKIEVTDRLDEPALSITRWGWSASITYSETFGPGYRSVIGSGYAITRRGAERAAMRVSRRITRRMRSGRRDKRYTVQM